ncbi:hypothetical protein BDA99DRAFT_543500 [Phascolomyces articulosus]|uniref:W2 domain-containing protein n=1 Tax=Phascolomyces articulosus TaxID=60185 RepID=A0AAD5JWY2_9FUNG|nr:hypothetical protein BDA99DRAFT_543500 [Phascolomyces articulosus]
MASIPWQQQQQQHFYYSQQQLPLPPQPQPITLLGGIRQKRLSPHELIKMLYEPTLIEDNASNSSSMESFTTSTSCTTTTDDSECSLSSLRKHNNHLHHLHPEQQQQKQRGHNNKNHHGGSSNTSTSSHESTSHTSKKRRSYHLLLREIRRLRAENDGLKQMVDTMKQDLRFERESRHISEQCHQKYYTESSDRQIELEVDVMDKEKEIEDLKERITELELVSSPLSTPTPTSTPVLSTNNNNHHHSNRWGCFEFDIDDELFCQPIMGESATPDPLTRLSSSPQDSSSSSEEESDEEKVKDDDDDDDDDDETSKISDDEKFEQLATSYLHQAMISKLTSARANLELDDLMLKYDPSPAVVLRMLATSFVVWVNNVVSNEDEHNAVKALANGVTEGFLNFWKAILEKHVHDDDDQCQFLNEAERILDHNKQQQNDQVIKVTSITMDGLVDNFHRLLVMLYKYDIVDGEAITRWWNSVVENKDDQQIGCRLRDDPMAVEDSKTLNRILEEDRQYCACQFEVQNKDDCITIHQDKNVHQENVQDINNNNNNNHSINHTNNNKSNNYNNAHSIQQQQQQQPSSTATTITSEISETPCKCQPLYTTTLPCTPSSPSDLVEKKPKKSVRILL